MLLNFTVKNYRSIRREQTFSMQATELVSHAETVMSQGRYRLLRSAVLYGANSSGKSNLIKAFGTMKQIVLGSIKLNPNEIIPDYDPFLLCTGECGPTSFEVECLIEGVCYRYGFEYTSREIVAEWLYEELPSGRERELFSRQKEEELTFSTRYFPEAKVIKSIGCEANRLILSLSAQLSGIRSRALMAWFADCYVLSGLEYDGMKPSSMRNLEAQSETREGILRLFNRVALGFETIKLVRSSDPKEDNPEIPEEFTRWILDQGTSGQELATLHSVYDEEGEVAGQRPFLMEQMESEGTKKLIAFSGYIFEALKHGRVLWIDELDAKLHPLLTAEIIRLFMEDNAHGAQLIFSTHDTNLLDLSRFREDQIWFTQKNKRAETELYSLVEFKPEELAQIRQEEHVGSSYLLGRFGAIPYIKRED